MPIDIAGRGLSPARYTLFDLFETIIKLNNLYNS